MFLILQSIFQIFSNSQNFLKILSQISIHLNFSQKLQTCNLPKVNSKFRLIPSEKILAILKICSKFLLFFQNFRQFYQNMPHIFSKFSLKFLTLSKFRWPIKYHKLSQFIHNFRKNLQIFSKFLHNFPSFRKIFQKVQHKFLQSRKHFFSIFLITSHNFRILGLPITEQMELEAVGKIMDQLFLQLPALVGTPWEAKEGPPLLTEEEFYAAVDRVCTKPKKALGPDGIPNSV